MTLTTQSDEILKQFMLTENELITCILWLHNVVTRKWSLKKWNRSAYWFIQIERQGQTLWRQQIGPHEKINSFKLRLFRGCWERILLWCQKWRISIRKTKSETDSPNPNTMKVLENWINFNGIGRAFFLFPSNWQTDCWTR